MIIFACKLKRYIYWATIAILLFWGLVSSTSTLPAAAQTTVPQNNSRSPSFFQALIPGGKDILCSEIPLFRLLVQRMPKVDDASFEVRVADDSTLLETIARLLLDIRFSDPGSLLVAEIPRFSVITKPVANNLYLNVQPKLVLSKNNEQGKPQVGIYHTHTSEAYLPDTGTTHVKAGTAGDIVRVGEALAKRLQGKHGITAVQSKTVHDYPSFMKAYGQSEKTVKDMLRLYPSLQMVFDVHRDAAKREVSTVKINGRDAAKIKIVVATGHAELPQPTWEQNHTFARVLEDKMNLRYPGLSRGLEMADWRYNQHLHPHCLILEVGAQENSLQEAVYSMELLAELIAEVFKEYR